MALADLDSSSRVDVAFAGPARQNRLTIVFRSLLALPQQIVLLVLSLAAGVVVFVGWFAALILGRLPDRMSGFLGRVLQYMARVQAYNSMLLTDAYPPFQLSPATYPVEVRLAPGPLNRLAVLFRYFLQIPASLLAGLVGLGLSLAVFFIWLIVLVAGRMPPSLHQALAAVLRYQIRLQAYSWMLTSVYPGGLFGDQASGPPPSAPPVEPSAPPADTAPPSATPGSETSWAPAFVPPAASGQQPGPAPLATHLVLSKPARRIVGLFIGLGVVWIAGIIAIVAVVASSSSLQASVQVSRDYGRLTSSLSRFERAVSSCQRSGQGLRCEQAAVSNLAPAFASFSSDLRGIDFPADAQADAQQLETDSDALNNSLQAMATAPSAAGYLAAAQRFQTTSNRFDNDYQQLQQDLI